jgi:glycosyltransferase involved in cell wall biosynthesis
MDGSHRRIAFFIPSLERGGIERFVVDISTALSELGVAVDVLAFRVGQRATDLPEAASLVELSVFGPVERALFDVCPQQVASGVASLPDLVRYLRRRAPDMVVTLQISPVALLGARLTGFDGHVVVRESNTPSIAARQATHPVARLTPLAKRLAYPRVDGIVTLSEGAREDVIDWLDLPPERVVTIYNPTHNEWIHERAAGPVDHEWFDTEHPVVVSVGRFVDQKDFETVVRGFAAIHEAFDARLVLIGDGPHRADLERLARRLGVRDAVAFLGYRDNPYPYIAGADVFAFASHYEGLGNVVVEAVSLGTPVVATDCPNGPRETLVDGAGGFLAPPGDPDAFGEQLHMALADPAERAKRLERARNELDRFTPDRAARQYLALLSDLDDRRAD